MAKLKPCSLSLDERQESDLFLAYVQYARTYCTTDRFGKENSTEKLHEIARSTLAILTFQSKLVVFKPHGLSLRILET